MLTSTRKVVHAILYTVVLFLELGNETGGLMQTKQRQRWRDLSESKT